MAPESWLVLTVAGAFLLLGVAGSPLAWAALHFRRTRTEEAWETRVAELARRLRLLEGELDRSEGLKPGRSGADPREPVAVALLRERAGAPRSREAAFPIKTHVPAAATTAAAETPLIAVPRLEAAPTDRDAAISGLAERYAAIWALADNGAKPDVIARATGQPIGQIELILGLRRQIDGNRTTISHASHR